MPLKVTRRSSGLFGVTEVSVSVSLKVPVKEPVVPMVKIVPAPGVNFNVALPGLKFGSIVAILGDPAVIVTLLVLRRVEGLGAPPSAKVSLALLAPAVSHDESVVAVVGMTY